MMEQPCSHRSLRYPLIAVGLLTALMAGAVTPAPAQPSDFSCRFRDPEFMRRCLDSAADGAMERTVVLGNVPELTAELARHGYLPITRTASVITAYTDRRTVVDMARLPGTIAVEEGWKRSATNSSNNSEDSIPDYQPLPLVLTDTLYRHSGIRQGRLLDVRLRRAPLDRSYDGRGVLIGVIESGLIDFRHPDFLDTAGHTRFVAIWDQRQNDGPSPAPFGYGTEWKPTDLNREIRGETRMFNASALGSTHVTQVAGVAAGSGFAVGRHCGVAPAAYLAHVSILHSEANVIDAVRYIYSIADSLNVPCVINFSHYLGQDVSDGSSIGSVAISEMVRERPGRIFVASAGNNSHFDRHVLYDGNRMGRGEDRVLYLRPSPSRIRFAGDSTYHLVARISHRDLERVVLRFGAVWYDSTGAVLPSVMPPVRVTPLSLTECGSPELAITDRDQGDTAATLHVVRSFLTDSTSMIRFDITPRRTGRSSDRGTERLLVAMQIGGEGVFEAWSEYFLLMAGRQIMEDEVQFPSNYLFPDNLRTVNPPADGRAVLAAGAFRNRIEFVGVGDTALLDTGSGLGNLPGSLMETTQPGGEWDGHFRPAVVAPGVGIPAPVPLELKSGETSWHFLQGGRHTIFSGTSAAAPALAGGIALYLQRYPTATFEQVCRALTVTACGDVETGPVPNARAGYGKLDFFALLCRAPDEETDPMREMSTGE